MVVVAGLFIKATLFVAAMRQVGYAASDVVADLRVSLLRGLSEARWSYFTSKPTGAITNAIGPEAIRVGHMFTETCYLLAACVQVAIYGIAALIVAPLTTLAAVLVGGSLFAILHVLVLASARAGQQETEVLKSLLSRVTATVGIMKPLKAMARHDAIQPLVEHESQELKRAYRRQILSRTLLIASQEPLIALVLGGGILLAVARGQEVEHLLFMALLFYRIATRGGNAQSHLQTVLSHQSAFVSLRTAIEEARGHRELAKGRHRVRFSDVISLNNVSLGYGERLVVENVTAAVPFGKTVLIVGSSGAGKTTIVDAVMGLLPCSVGSITVDNIPLDDLHMPEWRGQIGYVPQDVILLNDSVRMNVSLGQDFSDQDIEWALRTAQAWEFVQSLSNQTDTNVGERGLSLSAGQRQRIGIARALVSHPRLLIMDEGTAALDPETERNLVAALGGVSDLTILAISHHGALKGIADIVYEISAATQPSADGNRKE